MEEQLQNEVITEENNSEYTQENKTVTITNMEVESIEELDLSNLFNEKSSSYTKLSEKYEDMISSASTMLFVGIAGALFLMLVHLGIIPFPLGSTTWLFNLVMGGVFIVFIIAGIVSFIQAKQLKVEADTEDEMISDILSWSEKNIAKETLDEGLDTSQPEEILYFSRFEKIKNITMHQFENADEPLIDELSERIYQKIYEPEDK